MSSYTVGITGASGAIYGVRLVEMLARSGAAVALTATRAGLGVLREEAGLAVNSDAPVLRSLWRDPAVLDRVAWHPVDSLRSPLASGSHPSDGMIICPCSMNTLAAVACGLGENLVQRAAMVTLKERRPLVLVPRETPLSDIHLENMLRLSRSGAAVVPAMPAFYHRPQGVGDLVDSVVARVLQILGVPNELAIRWSPSGA